MTIREAITRIDNLKPNTFNFEEKIAWLSQLDGMIGKEIMNIHFQGYDADTCTGTVLLAEAPYDSLYISWLESRIDYYNGEYGKYNNSNTVFNTEYAAYQNYFYRSNKPNGLKIRYF